MVSFRPVISSVTRAVSQKKSHDAPEGAELVEAPLGGSVWKMLVRPGDRVEKGAVIAVIEAMKTECDVASPEAGVVREVYAAERQAIAAGAPMIALEPA